MTRSADQRQARLTSVIEDIRIWTDRAAANPAVELRDMLASYGCRGKRIGVEYHAYGLTAQRGRMVDAAFDLARLLRLVKSPAELAYFAQAGRLAEEACAVSQHLTLPGARIGAVYGEMMNAVMRGDGDPSASRWPMGRATRRCLSAITPTTARSAGAIRCSSRRRLSPLSCGALCGLSGRLRILPPVCRPAGGNGRR